MLYERRRKIAGYGGMATAWWLTADEGVSPVGVKGETTVRFCVGCELAVGEVRVSLERFKVFVREDSG